MSQRSNVVNFQSRSEQRIVDGSGIPDNIVINNCQDIHIGPKYVHHNTININQALPRVDGRGYVEADISSLSSVSSSEKNIPYEVHLRFVLFGSSFLLTVLIIIIVTLVLKYNPSPNPQFGEDREDYPQDNKFVTRDMWDAAPPCYPLPNLTLPVERVIFIHTAGSGTCNNFKACKNIVLDIQDFNRKDCIEGPGYYGDIGYNFIIGSDGHIFVGRGWAKMGRHTRGTNEVSIGVAFVGDFRIGRDEPSPSMLESAKTLLEVGVQRGKLSENYQLFGHCQCLYHFFPDSPGLNILNKIESWPHYNRKDWFNCSGFVPSHI